MISKFDAVSQPKLSNLSTGHVAKKTEPSGARESFSAGQKAEPQDWKEALGQFGKILQAKQDLGIADSDESAATIAKVLADTTPTSDLQVIADRKMAEAGLLGSFPAGVVAQANAVDKPAPISDGIQDLRHLTMVSVDNGTLNPATMQLEHESKDIDQCEHAEKLPNGNIRVRVAIADVDCLVEKGSPADQHAMHNSATVYTDDKIFAMLPEKFSTDLTSLNGDQDRLAMVKEFEVTPEGEVIEPKVYRAMIHNHAKMAYESVNEWLVDGQGPKPPQMQDPKVAEQIRLQDEASQRIQVNFYNKGALGIDSSEVKAEIVDGQVVGMHVDAQNRAKDLVKFSMMGANISSMQVLEAAEMPTLRRIVKTPEKWDKIVDLAKKFGTKLPPDANAKALNQFLESRKAAEPTKFEELCQKVVRLVGRGEYVVSTPGEPIEGHFCLAVQDYGHTTAPNRRGADLINQRIEKAVAEGKDCPYSSDELSALAEHFSEQEKVIQGVERKVHQSSVAKMMEPMIGQSFDGVVTRCDPQATLVKLKQPMAQGRLKGANVSEGDEVKVKLQSVNVEKGWIDFGPSNTTKEESQGFILR
jgi:VacB/RNase II family 3'-5' exoribonuclease